MTSTCLVDLPLCYDSECWHHIPHGLADIHRYRYTSGFRLITLYSARRMSSCGYRWWVRPHTCQCTHLDMPGIGTLEPCSYRSSCSSMAYTPHTVSEEDGILIRGSDHCILFRKWYLPKVQKSVFKFNPSTKGNSKVIVFNDNNVQAFKNKHKKTSTSNSLNSEIKYTNGEYIVV